MKKREILKESEPFFHTGTIFQNFFNDFERSFQNIENQIPKKGFQKIQQFQSFQSFENGKMVENNQKGFMMEVEDGKGFVKTMCKGKDGKVIMNEGKLGNKKMIKKS